METTAPDPTAREAVADRHSAIGEGMHRFASGLATRMHGFGLGQLVAESGLLSSLTERWTMPDTLGIGGFEVYDPSVLADITGFGAPVSGYDSFDFDFSGPYVIPVDPVAHPLGTVHPAARRAPRRSGPPPTALRPQHAAARRPTRPRGLDSEAFELLTPAAARAPAPAGSPGIAPATRESAAAPTPPRAQPVERWRHTGGGAQVSAYPARMGRAGAIDASLLRFPDARATLHSGAQVSIITAPGPSVDWAPGAGLAPAARAADRAATALDDRLSPSAPSLVDTWLVPHDAPSSVTERLAGRAATARPGRWESLGDTLVTGLRLPPVASAGAPPRTAVDRPIGLLSAGGDFNPSVLATLPEPGAESATFGASPGYADFDAARDVVIPPAPRPQAPNAAERPLPSHALASRRASSAMPTAARPAPAASTRLSPVARDLTRTAPGPTPARRPIDRERPAASPASASLRPTLAAAFAPWTHFAGTPGTLHREAPSTTPPFTPVGAVAPIRPGVSAAIESRAPARVVVPGRAASPAVVASAGVGPWTTTPTHLSRVGATLPAGAAGPSRALTPQSQIERPSAPWLTARTPWTPGNVATAERAAPSPGTRSGAPIGAVSSHDWPVWLAGSPEAPASGGAATLPAPYGLQGFAGGPTDSPGELVAPRARVAAAGPAALSRASSSAPAARSPIARVAAPISATASRSTASRSTTTAPSSPVGAMTPGASPGAMVSRALAGQPAAPWVSAIAGVPLRAGVPGAPRTFGAPTGPVVGAAASRPPAAPQDLPPRPAPAPMDAPFSDATGRSLSRIFTPATGDRAQASLVSMLQRAAVRVGPAAIALPGALLGVQPLLAGLLSESSGIGGAVRALGGARFPGEQLRAWTPGLAPAPVTGAAAGPAGELVRPRGTAGAPETARPAATTSPARADRAAAAAGPDPFAPPPATRTPATGAPSTGPLPGAEVLRATAPTPSVPSSVPSASAPWTLSVVRTAADLGRSLARAPWVVGGHALSRDLARAAGRLAATPSGRPLPQIAQQALARTSTPDLLRLLTLAADAPDPTTSILHALGLRAAPGPNGAPAKDVYGRLDEALVTPWSAAPRPGGPQVDGAGFSTAGAARVGQPRRTAATAEPPAALGRPLLASADRFVPSARSPRGGSASAAAWAIGTPGIALAPWPTGLGRLFAAYQTADAPPTASMATHSAGADAAGALVTPPALGQGAAGRAIGVGRPEALGARPFEPTLAGLPPIGPATGLDANAPAGIRASTAADAGAPPGELLRSAPQRAPRTSPIRDAEARRPLPGVTGIGTLRLGADLRARAVLPPALTTPAARAAASQRFATTAPASGASPAVGVESRYSPRLREMLAVAEAFEQRAAGGGPDSGGTARASEGAASATGPVGEVIAPVEGRLPPGAAARGYGQSYGSPANVDRAFTTYVRSSQAASRRGLSPVVVPGWSGDVGGGAGAPGALAAVDGGAADRGRISGHSPPGALGPLGALVDPSVASGAVRRAPPAAPRLSGGVFGDRGPKITLTPPSGQRVMVETGAQSSGGSGFLASEGRAPTRESETSEEAKHRLSEQSGGSLSPEERQEIALEVRDLLLQRVEIDSARFGMGEDEWD